MKQKFNVVHIKPEFLKKFTDENPIFTYIFKCIGLKWEDLYKDKKYTKDKISYPNLDDFRGLQKHS